MKKTAPVDSHMNDERRLRDMNEALLRSSVRQHELIEQAQIAERALIDGKELLRRNAETFARFVEDAPFGIYVVDSEFRIAQVNQGSQAAFRNVRPLIGRDFAQAMRILWPEPFATEAIDIFRRTLETGEPYVSPGLIEHRRDTGTTESYEWQTHRVTLAEGRFGVVCYFYDSTRLREAEEAVRQSEAKYRAIFEIVGVSLWEEDFSGVQAAIEALRRQGVGDFRRYFAEHPEFVQKALGLIRVLDVNDATVKMFQAQDKAQLLGFLPAIFAPESLPVFVEELMTVAEGRNYLEDEALLNTVAGNPIHVLFTMRLPPPTEKYDRVLFSVTDITQRKHAEQVAARLASIVTFSDDAIISKDLAGVVTTWNRGAEHLFGYTDEEMIGKSVTVLIPEDHLDEEPRILERIRRGESIEHYETVRRRKDGTLLDISLTVSPIRNDAGKVIGASKVARDITERKRLEDNLAAAADELAQLNRRKDEFLAMLSHELRNPLAPIRSAVHLLKAHSPEITGVGSENLVAKQAREIIERQVGNLTKIVSDLLEVSRVVSGRIRMEFQVVDLNAVVRHALETVAPAIEHYKHDLLVQYCDEPIWLNADATRLEEVVVNLLNNAAKYTEAGGGGRIEVFCDQGDGEARVRVRDNGVGIDAKLLPRIFDLFTQADRSLDRAAGGLGIGLSLVKRLVEMHGGAVEAFSPPTMVDPKNGARQPSMQGSEFVVTLPLAPMAAAQHAHPAKKPEIESRSEGMRVLLVDDNIDLVMMVSSALRAKGHTVQAAYTGPEGLKAAEQWRPEVVLLDIGLPGLDGYQVAKRLRAHDLQELRRARLIALTGYGRDGDIDLAREAGFDGHLVKPYDFDDLEELMTSSSPRR